MIIKCREEFLDYLKNANLEEVTPEEVINNLLQNGQIQFSDYLELQKEIEETKKPLLKVRLDPEQMIWDVEKWLEYSKTNEIMIVSSDK